MSKPNLIYVLADQLRWGSVGYNGDTKAITPNIDALRRESVDVCNAVSGHPVCAPYRASLFTGKYTTSTGMVINEIRLNPDHKCFAHALNEGGYNTSYVGKWHLYANEWGNHYDPKNSFVPPGPDRLGFDGYFNHYGFHHNFYGAAAYYHLDTPEKHYIEGYEPDAQTDLAMEQLDLLSAQDKPFALFLSVGTPHDPWIPENVPGKYLDKFKDVEFTLPENYLPDNCSYADAWARLNERERAELTEWMRVYYAMNANLDDNVGRLMAKVKALGLEENTIIVFTSDHGELFGAHGRRAKNIFYDEAVRVPFLIKHKGVIKENSSTGVCFNTVDIMPTFLSMMGLNIPDTVEGLDVSGAIEGKPDAMKPDGSLMMGTGATAVVEDGHEWRAIRTEQFTYAVYRVDKKEFLFDNIADPLQIKNLINDPAYKEKAQCLRDSMYAKMEAVNDTFEACSYYDRNWIRDRLILRTATQNADMVLN